MCESDLKRGFMHVTLNIANKALRDELETCDGKMSMNFVTTLSETHNVYVSVHSCYCLEKYIDATQSIVAFNSDRNATSLMHILADDYVNGIIPKCRALMKETIGCRLTDNRAGQIRCIQFYVNPKSEYTQTVIPSPFLGQQRLKASVEDIPHFRYAQPIF